MYYIHICLCNIYISHYITYFVCVWYRTTGSGLFLDDSLTNFSMTRERRHYSQSWSNALMPQHRTQQCTQPGIKFYTVVCNIINRRCPENSLINVCPKWCPWWKWLVQASVSKNKSPVLYDVQTSCDAPAALTWLFLSSICFIYNILIWKTLRILHLHVEKQYEANTHPLSSLLQREAQ